MGLPILDAIGSVANKVFGIVDELVTDKDQAAKLKHELHMTLSRLNMGQISVNRQEARHASIFVAGWRPAIGWVCALALAWQFIGAPVGQWFLTLYGLELIYDLPHVASDNLFELVLAMLGMAGLRTYEKRRGFARDHIGMRDSEQGAG